MRQRFPPRGWLVCVLVIAAAWGAWRHRLGIVDLDEAASNELIFVRQPLSTIVSALPWTDQSPLWFVVLHFWRLLGESTATIKALNLTLLTASLLVFYALGRRLCPPRVALGAIVLAALSPASLWVARSGRMYSLHLLLWVAGLYCAVQYLDRRRPLDLASFVAAGVLAIYNHFIGFVSTGTAVLWLFVEALAEMRTALPGTREEREAERRRLLGPPVAAALAIGLLVQPQVMRMLALLQAPPAVVAGQALPGGGLPFLDAVSWFWLMGADWGPLRAGAPILRSVYLAGAYLLFVMGLARGSTRLRRMLVTTVVFPLVSIGLAAGHMDFRDRHLLYLLPLVWLAIVNGGIGGDPEGVPVPIAVRRGAVAVLVTVGAASAWMLAHKLPERYVEWTKLMSGLAQLRRPHLVVSMAPGPLTGTPSLVASWLDPRGGLDVHDLTRDTRLEFMAQVDATRDFALLSTPWSPPDAEHEWRRRYLESRGYRRFDLSVTAATAQVFTSGGLPVFATVTPLPARLPSRDVVAWARDRAHDPARPRPSVGMWSDSLVARVDADGLAHESTFFASQHGENGGWRLGATGADTVEEGKATFGHGEEDAVYARPTGDSLLLLVFPHLDLRDGLRLTCGAAPPAAGQRKIGVVSAQVYLDDEEAAPATCPLGRWSEAIVDARAAGPTADLTLALSTVGADHADVWLRFGRSGRSGAPRAPAPAPAAGPVTLTPARTLKDNLDRLRVFRIGASGFGRVTGRFETVPRSAAEMHEAPQAAGEGGLDARWQIGDLPWDAVGLTRQRLAGEVRPGLWAHPKEGTVLVIEADVAGLGDVIEGYYGLTDYSVETAKAARISEPVRFRVSLDRRLLLAREVPRAPGGTTFAAALGEAHATTGRLRVEVEAARDDWAHFVFDLWTR
jgi:hypothetical protein